MESFQHVGFIEGTMSREGCDGKKYKPTVIYGSI